MLFYYPLTFVLRLVIEGIMLVKVGLMLVFEVLKQEKNRVMVGV